jgi:hypothetical protein
VTLQRFRITGGNGTQGGGIFNGGTLSIESCTIKSNITGGSGGGIHNEGSLTATNLIVSDNVSGVGGGGIANTQSLELRDTIVVRNKVEGIGNGGGILNGGDGTVTLTDCDVIQNRSSLVGGGIFQDGSVDSVMLNNSLILGNDPDNCAPSGAVSDCSG